MSYNTPEGKVKKKLVEMLKKHKIWYFFPASNGFGKAGIPDVIACIDGLLVGIECKADKTKSPTVLQIECGKGIRQSGGFWFLVYDEQTIGDVEKFILKNR